MLSKELLSIPPEEILTTEAVLTIIGGKVVYQKD